MAEPCLCGQATAEPVCTVTAGAGITVSGGTIIAAHSAAQWLTYVPTTANFTLGNGLNDSRYLLNGKTLDVIVAFRFGTTSTFTALQWRVGLPAGAVPFFGTNTIALNHSMNFTSMKDVSAVAAPWFSGQTILTNNALPLSVRIGDDASGTNSVLVQGSPFTFTNLDELVIRARFEVV